MKSYKIVAKLHGMGKVTIPYEIREVLSLSDGDFVELVVSRPDENGE